VKTKGKLTFIVTIIGAILFLAASFLVWNSIATYRMVNTVTPSLEVLRLLKETQSRLHNQQYNLVHFIVSGEDDYRKNFISRRSLIEDKLMELVRMVWEQQARGISGEDKVEENINIVMQKYLRYLEKAEACIQTKRAGRTDEAIRNLDIEATSYFDAELLPVLSRMSRDEKLEIHEAYSIITRRLGALPWVAGPGMEQVERAVSAVDYDLAVSNAELGMYRQVNELTEFLLYGKTGEWEEFLGYRFEMRRLLDEWHQTIARQQALGMEGEDDDEKQFEAIRARYENILLLMEKTAAIRRSQGRSAGLESVERTLRFPLDNVFFSTMEVIGKESRDEVQEAHGALLRTVVIGSAAGLTGIVLASVLVLLLVLRMSTTIISSLTLLKDGTELIKGGDLEHHIRIAGSDEFSELASSFNGMADSLKERNDELRSFIYSIAHDLRAPLVNLKGFSNELSRDLAGVMPALLMGLTSLNEVERKRVAAVLEQAIPEALGYIDASTQKLEALISAFLQLSRIGSRVLDPEALDTEGLVQAALRTFAHTVKEKNITVTVGPLPSVVADRMDMEQCIANILGNAFKYLEPGRAGVVSITAERTKDEAILYFQDNGRGIAPDDIQKVFELFRRAGKQDTPGEGVGLAFVKALARRQGGNIWCESASGNGTKFCLSIPVKGEQSI